MMNKLFNVKYLSEDQMHGLNQHVYSAIDSSPLSRYIMHPFWNCLVEYMPLWFAPNLMTFVGFNMLVIGCFLLTMVDPHFDTFSPELITETHHPPLWLLLLVLQFMSHTLDGIDGKQARRLKCSSALGELFDHGLDSWSCGLLPLPFFSVISSHPPFGLGVMKMHSLLWLIYFSFFLSHWEKYNTGVLYLPWSYDVSMMLLSLCYLLVACFTPRLFWFNVPIVGLPFSQVVFLIILFTVFLMSLPISLRNIKLSFDNGKNIWTSYLEILRPFSSMAVLFVASSYWLMYSANAIAFKQPRMFFFATCTTYSSLVCRLIIAQMSKTKCKPFNLSLIPYLTAFFLSCFYDISYSSELLLLTCLTVYITAAHAHYGICVVRQIAGFFDIPIFSVKSSNGDVRTGSSGTKGVGHLSSTDKRSVE